jgi:hypothetical protein
VKRLLFAIITFGFAIGGRLEASGVIACSEVATLSSCVANKLPSFQTQLDWAVLGQSFVGDPVNGTWTSGSGINFSVTSQGANSDHSEGLRLAYNIGSVFYNSQWMPVGNSPWVGYTHPGRFNGAQNPSDTIANLQADKTIQLLGLALQGTAPTDAGLLIGFDNPFVNLGFYASSKTNATFDLTFKFFASSDGTGPALDTVTFTNLVGGGTCGAQFQGYTEPVACGDAPFFFANGYSSARSFLVTSSDPNGFYLSNLWYGDAGEVPEPGPMVLCGCGIVLLAVGSRKWRRKTTE